MWCAGRDNSGAESASYRLKEMVALIRQSKKLMPRIELYCCIALGFHHDCQEPSQAPPPRRCVDRQPIEQPGRQDRIARQSFDKRLWQFRRLDRRVRERVEPTTLAGSINST
jgi:hypothetical protein